MSVLASTLSPLLAANTLTLTLYFETPFTKIALLTGYHLLGVGVAGFVFVASARVWGKRHLYLLGTVIIIISSAWGGGSGHNYNSLLAARVFQGVGLAPFEALVNASVGDLYFVHERGKRMALSNLSLFGGAFFSPLCHLFTLSIHANLSFSSRDRRQDDGHPWLAMGKIYGSNLSMSKTLANMGRPSISSPFSPPPSSH